jgi:hypothetical protein
MAFSQTTSQIAWGGSNTNTIASGNTANSDDFTASTSNVGAEAQLYAKHSGTPASGDTIDFYLQRKGDPDQDATSEYDNQGDYIGTVDTNSDDPAKKTIPLGLMQGQTYRVTATNNGGSGITVGVRITEVTWS